MFLELELFVHKHYNAGRRTQKRSIYLFWDIFTLLRATDISSYSPVHVGAVPNGEGIRFTNQSSVTWYGTLVYNRAFLVSWMDDHSDCSVSRC